MRYHAVPPHTERYSDLPRTISGNIQQSMKVIDLMSQIEWQILLYDLMKEHHMDSPHLICSGMRGTCDSRPHLLHSADPESAIW
jgi:hypothetical protein